MRMTDRSNALQLRWSSLRQGSLKLHEIAITNMDRTKFEHFELCGLLEASSSRSTECCCPAQPWSICGKEQPRVAEAVGTHYKQPHQPPPQQCNNPITTTAVAAEDGQAHVTLASAAHYSVDNVLISPLQTSNARACNGSRKSPAAVLRLCC